MNNETGKSLQSLIWNSAILRFADKLTTAMIESFVVDEKEPISINYEAMLGLIDQTIDELFRKPIPLTKEDLSEES